MSLYLQRVDTTSVSPDYSKLETAMLHFLTTPRQASEYVHDEPADRVVLLVYQFTVEIFIKIFDARQCANGKTRFAIAITVRSDDVGG